MAQDQKSTTTMGSDELPQCSKCGWAECLCKCKAPAPQPVLDAGDWRVVGLTQIVNENGRTVAAASGNNPDAKARHATQIVADHRSAAAVPKLVAALLNESLARPDGPCWCDDGYDSSKPHREHCQNVRELLSAVQGKEQG